MGLPSDQELEFLRAVYDSAEIGICVTDENRCFVMVNPAYCRTYGYSEEELIGQSFVKMLPQEMRERAAELHDGFLEGVDEAAGEWEVVDKSDRRRKVMVTAGLVKLASGRRFKVTTVLDVTEHRATERQLTRLADVVSQTSHGVIFTDQSGKVTWINKGTERLTGFSSEEMLGQTPGDLLQGPDTDPTTVTHMAKRLGAGMGFQVEILNYTKAGDPYWLHIACSPVHDKQGNLEGYMALQTDISERVKIKRQIENLAFHDPLTGLPNRRMLDDQLNYCKSASGSKKSCSALLLLDLDDFNRINDTLGPREGDRLLSQAAEALLDNIYGADLIARPGGDEFVVIFSGLPDDSASAAQRVESIAVRMLNLLGQPFGCAELEHRVSASLGIVLFKGEGLTNNELIQQANIALHQAKKAGGDTFRFFDPKMQTALLEHHREMVDLREALRTDQLSLCFQGQVDCRGQLLAAEALVRWQHPTRGLLLPGEFIKLAEESDLIFDLGWTVMDVAARQLAAWKQDRRSRDLYLSVNVSLKQFEERDFAERLSGILAKHGLVNPNLMLEITESVLASDIQNLLTKMNKLRDIGVEFSLDDFGTGYSSLAYLKRLPINQLKIDRSFVDELSSDQSDFEIIDTIIALAKALKMDMVVEGVETEAQYALLRRLGCRTFQGFFFDKPAPISEFSARYNLPDPD